MLIDGAKISTTAVGLKLHWYLLQKPKNELSFNFGGGYFTSISSKQTLPEIVSDAQTNQVLDIVQQDISTTRRKPFITPGLSYSHEVYKNFGLGIEAMAFFEQSSEGIIIVPVQADFYALGISLTKKF